MSQLIVSYADKTKKKIQPLTSFDYPKEDQGIIFNHLEGTKIRDYLLAIHQLIGGAKNILAASRVSGSRVIIFLASREMVEKFQKEHGGFHLGTSFVKTRVIKTPATKLIISNISPTVPNTAIEDQLTNTFNLKLASPISVLRVSPTDDIFSHVVSWRRQVYIHSDSDLSRLPPSFELIYAERTYRIFLTQDNLTCFKCGSNGHKADICPQTLDGDEEVEDALQNTDQSKQLTIPISPASAEDFPSITPPSEKSKFAVTQEHTLNPLTPHKRTSSTLASSSTSETNFQKFIKAPTSPIPQANKDKKQDNKRQKTDHDGTENQPVISLEEQTKISEKINLLRSSKYVDCDFTADEFLQFLPAVRKSKHKIEVAKSFTANLPQLEQVLYEIKPDVSANTKRTITALVKSIQAETLSDSSD